MVSNVSVIILSQNSEKSIKRTLDSVSNFEEIVVIDGGSTDKTKDIVESYNNAKFITNKWPGFNAQRNFSLTQATHPWVFMIDSDEECTPELYDEIRKITNSKDNTKKLYRVMRTEYFCGRPMESGLNRAMYQERIYKKAHISYGGGVHHTHNIDGVHVGPDHPEAENIDPKIRILHNPDYELQDIYPRITRYAIDIAKERMAKGKKVSFAEIIFTLFALTIKSCWYNRHEGSRGLALGVVEAIHKTLMKLYIYQEQKIKKDL